MKIKYNLEDGWINLLLNKMDFAITWRGNYTPRKSMLDSIKYALPRFWSFGGRGYHLNIWRVRFSFYKKWGVYNLQALKQGDE